MNLHDAGYSLKLECALRGLGFVEIGWRVVANAGIYFVRPVSTWEVGSPTDDLLGFQLYRSEEYQYDKDGLHLGCPIAPSAKRALDLAINLS